MEVKSTSTLRIFVSCGSPYTAKQEAFLSAVEAHLQSHNCSPQTVGRTVYSARQPVEASRDLIGECDGIVVIAFARTLIIDGREKPGSPEEKPIFKEAYPTIWNQMEAAMAYAQKIPILTFVETGLKRQGMLSDRLEWMAMETDLTPTFLMSEHFRQVFNQWLIVVQSSKQNPKQVEFDPTELKLTRLASLLTIKQASVIALTILSILASIIVLAFKAGIEWVDVKRHLSTESPATISVPSTLPPPTNRANPK